jgi:hypothetical protein
MMKPPLIMLAEGRKPRLRKPASVHPKEIALHMQVADLLRQHCREEWLWTHFPAGEVRNIRVAHKLKIMGVKRGWPDFMMIPSCGIIHSLELKRKNGRLTEDQEIFQNHAIRHGWPHCVARSMDDVLKIFDHWGCLRIMI